jgi:hypothetical protein
VTVHPRNQFTPPEEDRHTDPEMRDFVELSFKRANADAEKLRGLSLAHMPVGVEQRQHIIQADDFDFGLLRHTAEPILIFTIIAATM